MPGTYDFRSLSPEDFERPVADLLTRLWERQIESFRSGRDKGVDLRASFNETGAGKIIVQCKRFEPKAFDRLLRVLAQEELKKVENLAPSRYVLVTSVSLGFEQKEKLAGALAPWCKSTLDILGAEDVNFLLRRYPDVERVHFKLWLGSTEVLQRLLNADVWNLSGATVEEVERGIRRFVIHDGVHSALEILHRQHHCLIVGVPGIGKTTLAQILLLHYIHLGFEPVIVSQDIDEAWRVLHVQSDEQKVVVLYDDFLGQVSFDAAKLGKNEESRLITLMKLCERRAGLRFILTTREYILADAMRQHARLAAAKLDVGRFTLRLEHYTKANRARILFNHLFFSDLPDSRLHALVESRTYRTIVEHANFSPRIVEAISEYANFRSLTDEQYVREVVKQLDDPASIWALPFDTQIRPDSRLVLMVVWSFHGPAIVDHIEDALGRVVGLERGQELTSRIEASLRELDGNFLSTERYPRLGTAATEYLVAKFHNPSIRDFLDRRVRKRPETIADVVEASVTFGQADRAFSALARLQLEPGPVRAGLACRCWERAIELLDLAGLGVAKIGERWVVRQEPLHGVVDRLLSIARMSLLAGTQTETSALLARRLVPESALKASSPSGTRAALVSLLDFCAMNSLLDAETLRSISRLVLGEAQRDLSEASWLVDAVDSVAVVASTTARGDSQALEAEAIVRGLAANVLDEFKERSIDLEEIQSERDRLSECAVLLGANFDDLLEELDEAIEKAERGFDPEDFDERVARVTERGADFDIDGLFSGLTDRQTD